MDILYPTGVTATKQIILLIEAQLEGESNKYIKVNNFWHKMIGISRKNVKELHERCNGMQVVA